MVITIDGPSGTGKSTVAKRLADRLGYIYFDTGALYRAIAWQILRDNISLKDIEAVKAMLTTFTFHVETNGNKKVYRVDTQDVTQAIRSEEVTAIVSEVSAMACVRYAMQPFQERASKQGPTVFEGRDLGTAIFPHADFKFFLTATPEVRAYRRLQDLKKRFPHGRFEYQEILEKISERDSYDSSRTLAPLKQAEDAIFLDTSDLSIDQVVSVLESYIEGKVS